MKKTKPEQQPGYEFKPEEYSSPGMQRMQERLTTRAIELLGVPKARVLDIGCGNGYSTGVLKENGYEVKGIDPEEKMIQAAKATGLDCRIGSFEKIPFKDREFDAVISISALQWVKEYRLAAKEVSRVLKYTAKAVIQFYPKNDEDAIKAAKAFAREGFKAELVIDNPHNQKKRKTFLLLER